MLPEQLAPNIVTKPVVDIIIPTYDNPYQLQGCVQSLFQNTQQTIFRVTVANNGVPKSLDSLKRDDGLIRVVDMGSNKGWEGAINEILPMVDAPFVCMLNDDTHFLPSEPLWLLRILNEFRDPMVGAVGPSSNYVMQRQNVFMANVPRRCDVPVLVGLCMFVRTGLLKELGGLGKELPGGDDLDLSMRITKAGYKLRCTRDVFVYHHGAQTGRRVYGAYWDSEEHQDLTNIELIRRNGFKNFMNCRYGQATDVTVERFNGLTEDAEGLMIKEFVRPGTIVELGCGGRKTIENSVGVDVFPKGTPIPSLGMSGGPAISVADVVSSVMHLPFDKDYADTVIARHILEHLVENVSALREWGRIIKKGGHLIIAVPDQEISNSIPMNPEHVNSYTQKSLSDLISVVLPNFCKEHLSYANNGMSFVGVFKRES